MHLHVRAQTRMLVVADDAQHAEEGPPMKKTRDNTLSPLDILQTLEIAVGGAADGSSSADLEPPHGPPPATPISKLRKVGKKVRRSSAYLGCDAARRRMACMAWMAALNGPNGLDGGAEWDHFPMGSLCCSESRSFIE